MGAYIVRPSLREQLQAIFLAALCAAVFLGEGLLPGNALLPFPPEVYEPLRSEALATGTVTEAELLTGNREMGDKFNQSIAWDRITQSRLSRGELPLWTRDIAGGVPFVPQMGQVYEPWNALLILIPSAEIYGIWYLLHLVGFGWLAYRFFRRLEVCHEAALFGLVCVVLGLWTQARIHHNVILTAALPCFGMLSCVHALFYDGRSARSAGLLALGAGLSFLSGFAVTSLQISYLCVAFAVFLAWQRRDWRPLLWVFLALFIGALLSMAQMGPVLRAAEESARDEASLDVLAETALVPQHALTMIWPDLFRWPDPKLYDLDGMTRMPLAAFFALPTATSAKMNFPETAFGLGTVATVLCFYLGREDRMRFQLTIFFASIALLALMLTMALPPVLQLSVIVPGARAGDLRRYLFLVAIGLAVLATFGADRVHRSSTAPKALIVSLAVVLVMSLIGMGIHMQGPEGLIQWWSKFADWRLGPDFPGVTNAEALFRSALSPGEAAANLEHGFRTFARASFCAGAGLLVLLWRRAWSLRLLTVLLVFELVHSGAGTIVAVDSERLTTPPRTLQPVLEHESPNGVRPRLQRLDLSGKPANLSQLLPPNLGAFYGIEDLAAYNPLPKRRMEEFFLAIEPKEDGKKASMVFGGAGVGPFQAIESLQHPLVDLLGIEFILCNAASNAQLADLLKTGQLKDVTPRDVPGKIRLFERSTSLPRATFVDRAIVLPTKPERLAHLSQAEVQVHDRLVLEDKLAPEANGDGHCDAEVEILLHADEQVRIRVHTKEPGYLRLADPYDDGWTATVDGEPAPIWVADHYLRAVYLEPGEHEVVFAYAALVVHAPRWISIFALFAVISLCFWPVKRRQEV